jgi:hypothetical protein
MKEKETKQIIDFDELINSHLTKKSYPKKIGRYYPSGIGDCLRKTWFTYLIPKEFDKDLLKIFQAGNMLHDFITDVIKSEKNSDVQLLEHEMPVKVERKDYTIAGRIDNLLSLKVDEKPILIEVKSSRLLPKYPKSEHIMQLQFYMYATKVWDGVLVYIQRDNLQTKTFHIRCRKQRAKQILERFDKLHYFLTNNKFPRPEYKLRKDKRILCNYCPYKNECEKEIRERLHPKLKPNKQKQQQKSQITNPQNIKPIKNKKPTKRFKKSYQKTLD